jgi:hypothetical protein
MAMQWKKTCSQNIAFTCKKKPKTFNGETLPWKNCEV